MSKAVITEQYLTDIANAIRTKTGETANYTPPEMANKILTIPSGGGGAPVLQNKSHTPTETSAQITADSGYDGLGTVTVSGITPTYVGTGVTRKSAETFTPSTTNQTIAANQYLTGAQTIAGDADLVASNIKHDTSIFNITGTFGMKIEEIINAPSERGTTISFTGLKAQPKAFACNLEFQGTFNSARTVYSMIFDGTTLSNCTSYRSGSSLLCYKYTTCTWTYNNGTLTITSPSTGSVGYFQPYDYHLIYFYEE